MNKYPWLYEGYPVSDINFFFRADRDGIEFGRVHFGSHELVVAFVFTKTEHPRMSVFFVHPLGFIRECLRSGERERAHPFRLPCLFVIFYRLPIQQKHPRRWFVGFHFLVDKKTENENRVRKRKDINRED